jgi:hypothetical protein
MPPMALTADMIAALEAVGIKNPATSKWRRMRPSTEPKVYSSEHICWCGGNPKRVASIPFEGGPRPASSSVIPRVCETMVNITQV